MLRADCLRCVLCCSMCKCCGDLRRFAEIGEHSGNFKNQLVSKLEQSKRKSADVRSGSFGARNFPGAAAFHNPVASWPGACVAMLTLVAGVGARDCAAASYPTPVRDRRHTFRDLLFLLFSCVFWRPHSKMQIIDDVCHLDKQC